MFVLKNVRFCKRDAMWEEIFQRANEVDRSNTKSIKLFPTQRELKGLETRH